MQNFKYDILFVYNVEDNFDPDLLVELLDGCIMLEQPYGIINILQYLTFVGTVSRQKKYFIVNFLISVLEYW